jgi:uncharacterized sulfatase
VDPPDDIDGISYAPTLLGEPGQWAHEYLYFASEEGETSVGIRYGNWKLVRYSSDDSSTWRLYALADDLGEQRDLANERPDVVQEILALLERDGLLGAPERTAAHGGR